MLKKSSFSYFFKKMNKKPAGDKHSSGRSGGAGDDTSCGGGRWKRKFSLYLWFVDGIFFKIVSILEATVMVLTLCAFYLCCGCHI